MPGKQKYTRKLSYNERAFIAGDEICHPLVNQFFLDGDGSFDLKKWNDAVAIASEANPGSRLVLKGSLGMSRWVDSGITPPVTEIDGGNWDGTGPDGAPYLQKRLFPMQGPTCEVLLIKGNPLRICFRSHHAVMDGRGMISWMMDIFRVLRGEEPIGARSTISDMELARSIQKEYRKPFPRDSIAPAGRAAGSERGVIWKRIFVPGRFKNILGQIAILTAREAWKHQEGPVRFGVPVDLRAHDKTLQSTCNLSIAIYIEVTHDSTPESVALDIKKQLEEKKDCMIDRWDPLIRYIPLKTLISKGESMIKTNNERGRYGISGLLTNMGKIPMVIFTGGGFNAKAIWGIPPSIETMPFFLGMATHDDMAEISVSMPKVLASNGRLDELLQNFSRGLIPA